MLEVKNLTKIYSAKGGADVKAIDDVSVSFGHTGLVFLLGKSGSGKSTLLNLIGGLDAPTSGEIIVYGKSSKSFSGGDFDSYRNTYIGFVFQEYNILNEFNVEENVALALELQGKRKNERIVDEILEEVGLRDYAKRKPNTLSGGQKQRVAIARALVKNPQIILADEPTGALDTATGKQVFETLKELSATRLVLVVSHDREFATTYGDRIIELKDGKIISDISKIKEKATYFAPSVMKLGEDAITVDNGKKLDKKSLKAISDFISACDGDVIITRGKNDIANFRRLNKIDENGSREVFGATPLVEGGETCEVNFIRSKLPVSKAIKISASGLKLKPFRLILTILLSIVSFIMFGLFSTMMLYNERTVIVKSFMASDYSYIDMQKQYKVEIKNEDDSTYSHYNTAKFTRQEVNDFGKDSFGIVKGYASISMFDNVTMPSKYYTYYKLGIEKLAFLPIGHPLRDTVIGDVPTANDEILISSYMLDCLCHSTYKDYSTGRLGDEIKINTARDIIGKYIGIRHLRFKVVGVFDSGELPSKFDKYKEADSDDNEIVEEYIFREFLSDGLFMLAFVSESSFETYKNLDNLLGDSFWFYDSTTLNGETKYVEEENAIFDGVMTPLPRNEKNFSDLLDKLYILNPKNDVRYVMDNSLYQEVKLVNGGVKSLSEVFLWVGLVLALFASLMLFNFISLSITNKKKEIGILRAVGARGVDVFKIFFAEAVIIVGICSVLSIISTALLSVFINDTLKSQVGLNVTLFVFGPLPILLMLSIAVVVAVVSTFLPVYLAARKKPVDSIRSI